MKNPKASTDTAVRKRKAEPTVKPCYEGRELQVDSEMMNVGLSVISLKGSDNENPKSSMKIKPRNSYRSLHRPELSKLDWAANCEPRQIEEYLSTRITPSSSNTNDVCQQEDTCV